MPSDALPPAVRPRIRSRIPLGFVGMIAIIVGVESCVMKHDYDLTTLVASNWQIEGKAPARHAAGHEILCFGDSMVKFGIQPRVLGASLGKSVYNFALYCGPPQTSYYMLQRAFDAGAKPAAVLVDFQPELLMGDAMTLTSRTFPEILTFRELFDLCWRAHGSKRSPQDRSPSDRSPPDPRSASDYFAEYVVSKLIPSSRKRYEIRAAVLAAIKGESVSVKERLLAARRNWKLNKGAEALAKNPYYFGEVPEFGAYPAMFWMPWKCNELSRGYLERFLELAASRKVPVFWLLQPNANEVDLKREKVGYNAMYNQFVRHYQDLFPNLVVVDGRHVNYPYQYFTDPVHLDRNGAVAYSLGVADVVRAYLEGSSLARRWVDLPDRRARSEEVALEDNGQSAVVIKAEAEATKVRR